MKVHKSVKSCEFAKWLSRNFLLKVYYSEFYNLGEIGGKIAIFCLNKILIVARRLLLPLAAKQMTAALAVLHSVAVLQSVAVLHSSISSHHQLTFATGNRNLF